MGTMNMCVRFGSLQYCDRNSRTPQLLCRYFLINSVFECIDDNLLTRVCDLKLGKTTLLLFASATTSVAMFAFKIAHIQVWTRALRSGVCARASSACVSMH